MTGARLAWAFLTRLPGGAHPVEGQSMAAALGWFPVVGAVLGAFTGLAHLGLSQVVSAPLAALVAVALGVLVTGAFHEDGLADTFDSLGGHSPERRLEIMRDSRIGTFGTLALVLVVGAKVFALIPLDGPDGLPALVLAHTLGRVGALVVMRIGPEASTDGLAATVGEVPGMALVIAGLGMTAAAALGPPTAVAAVGVVAVAPAITWFARRRLGGITGDVLGAAEQLGEVLTLVAVSELVTDHGWLWS